MNETIGKVQEQLDNFTFGNGPQQKREDIVNLCSEMVVMALFEQLWVGIIPKALVQQLEKRLPRTPYPLGKLQFPNRWRSSVSRILTTLA